MLISKQKLTGLSRELFEEITFFKDEMDKTNPTGGKIQMNPLPEPVKQLLQEDPSMLIRLKSDTGQLPTNEKIWTFPSLRPSIFFSTDQKWR